MRLALHLRRQAVMYIVFSGVLLLGLIIGCLAPAFSDEAAKEQVYQSLDSFLETAQTEGRNGWQDAWQWFWVNGALLLLLYLFGMHILGLPIIGAVLFYKGFSLGYSLAFLYNYQGFKFFLPVFLSILPQTLLIVPLLLIAAVLGACFSRGFWRPHDGMAPYSGPGRRIGGYSLKMSVLLLPLILAALCQGFVAPLVLDLVFVAA